MKHQIAYSGEREHAFSVKPGKVFMVNQKMGVQMGQNRHQIALRVRSPWDL
ncbi:hypothetical protein [Oleiphilus messinensis]|uniref:hypothetical protein n=1 Tax=Oleiphilus messinensis TaxID=141451 RepID=UPI0018DF5B3A|nr:hypothetical protein [Oleiphilus messinensis]